MATPLWWESPDSHVRLVPAEGSVLAATGARTVMIKTNFSLSAPKLQISHAVAVFRTMVERRIAPNAITCHALFNGCLRQGDVLLAREVRHASCAINEAALLRAPESMLVGREWEGFRHSGEQ